MNKYLYRNLPFRIIMKMGLDIAAFTLSFAASYMLRFEINYIINESSVLLSFLVIYLVLRLSTFFVFRLYSSMWRFTALHTLTGMIKATSVGSVLILISAYFLAVDKIPRSVIVLDWFLVLFFCGGIRIFTRYVYNYNWNARKRKTQTGTVRTLIYGAGQAGELLLRNTENARDSEIVVVGFIDDDLNKKGKYIHNKLIFGDCSNLGSIVRKHNINSIHLSIPSLSGLENRKILKSILDQVGDTVEIKTIPGLIDLMKDRFSITQLRKFEIKDLLRRKPVSLDFGPVEAIIKDKTVLVVGGGGSIGSELCSQIAFFNPACIVILDNTEFNCYRTEASLKKEDFSSEVVTIVADACNDKMLKKVFNYYQPALVFHAAAYKHVPMMEMNPWAATYNNLKSTLNLARLSKDFKVERFILISTDKAVQPTSVMGATKRICEQIIQLYNHGDSTKFITVRFGNVLGSSGSVIPKFKEQIEAGGPITVTHPEISRYFMLISEAVELVLQAAAIGKSGNIYVLDMGEPIKIVDLAKYMIELTGLKLDEDMRIEFTGLRPGEKIRESLYLKGEENLTDVPNLFVLTPKHVINRTYLDMVNDLLNRLYQMDHSELRTSMKKMVPEFEPYIAEHIQLPFVEQSEAISVKFESA